MTYCWCSLKFRSTLTRLIRLLLLLLFLLFLSVLPLSTGSPGPLSIAGFLSEMSGND